MCGVVAGKAMEVDKWHGALPAAPAYLDYRIQRYQRDCEIRGVRGDAAFARPEHGVPPVFAADGRTAGTGRALVACAIAHVAEIGTPRALQEIAAHGRLVAYLRARRVQQRLGDHGELLHHRGVGSHVGHRGGGTELKALRSDVDAVVEQTGQTHQLLGPPHILLQQLHHVGAAGDVLGRRVVATRLRAQREGGREVTWTF